MTGLDPESVRRRWDLVLPYRDYLVRIAVRRGLPAGDAEDCAHEAMVRCVEFADLDETRVVQFLAATTMRLCVDRHRQHLRDGRAESRLRAWYADEPSPEDVVCDRAEAAWVARRIDDLPASQRAAVASKAEGLSCAEVAHRLAVSYKSVESLLSRARTQVRAAVASTLVALAAWQRRGQQGPEIAVAVALSAVVAVSVVLGGATPGRRGDGAGTAPRYGDRAGVSERSTAAGAGVGGALGRPAGVRLVPAPGGGPDGDPGWPAPPLPRPTFTKFPVTSPPQPACGLPLPAEACLPLGDYTPGENYWNCVQYGPDLSRGFECRRSPTPGEPSPTRK